MKFLAEEGYVWTFDTVLVLVLEDDAVFACYLVELDLHECVCCAVLKMQTKRFVFLAAGVNSKAPWYACGRDHSLECTKILVPRPMIC